MVLVSTPLDCHPLAFHQEHTMHAAIHRTRHNPSFSPDDIEGLARKRAGAKLGWLIHAVVFVLVNTLLIVISVYTGKPWAIFPLMGWGLGLVIHGLFVWSAAQWQAVYERLVQRERAQLASQRDPW
jgi:hypothetical protein